MLGSVDLLGSDASPQFTSQVAKGSTTPFTFAVFGDWGQANAGSSNPDQANVLRQLSLSGARFAVMTGDTAYQSGSQTAYGDLHQTGTNISSVFAPSFWTVPGRSIPVFNVPGNHGFTQGAVQVVNWPEDNAASTSNGSYKMESYPSINGSDPASYPSMWYAFDAGPVRFYALTAAWSDANIGHGTDYEDDHDAHWTTNSAEYQWLKNDLAAHPNSLKFAFLHYPLYADSGTQGSDTYLQGGSGTLQGLLNQYGVNIAFNGHAHGYERNKADAGGMVSYVFGNGGADLGAVSGCKSYDLYAIGLNGTHCGAAPSGLSNDHVYGFAKVKVDGRQGDGHADRRARSHVRHPDLQLPCAEVSTGRPPSDFGYGIGCPATRSVTKTTAARFWLRDWLPGDQIRNQNHGRGRCRLVRSSGHQFVPS